MNQHDTTKANAMSGQKAIESLERSMTQFHAFQAETLRTHAAYLQDQLECSASMILARQMRFAQELKPAAQPIETAQPITNTPVHLKSLPWADRQDIAPSTCLLTDDGTDTTTRIAEMLHSLGWSLIILRYPTSILAKQAEIPDGIDQIELQTMDEAHLQTQLSSQSIQSFIYLHPPFQLATNESILFSETEATRIKHVFFIAKHLKNTLNQTSDRSHRAFITVARLDGQLGLSQNTISPLGGGLFGLTKSLNLEWPTVFCRAIDLDPTLDANASASHLMNELHDPDRQLSEVAIGPKGRFTLTLQESA